MFVRQADRVMLGCADATALTNMLAHTEKVPTDAIEAKVVFSDLGRVRQRGADRLFLCGH